MAKRESTQSRHERLAAIQASQRKAERRRGLLIYGTTAVIVAVLIGGAAYGIMRESGEKKAIETAAAKPVEGVEKYGKQTRNHIPGPVDYPLIPTVGGDHSAIPLTCGSYRTEVSAVNATHSQEHGAIWIGYRPDLSKASVERLEKLAKTDRRLIVSPVSSLKAPIALGAWGVRLEVKTADDPRIPVFITKYEDARSAPEPGAACEGTS